MTVTFDGADYVTTYNYLSANRPGETDLMVGKVNRTYDSLQRETEHRVYSNDASEICLETTTTFTGVSGNRTTQLPKIYTTFRTDGETSTRPGGYTGFTYAYDNNGNITSITETNGSASRVRSYTYDTLNQLTQDVDPVTGKTTTYTYDTRGNILSKTASGQTVTYTYGDSTWPDLLTAYNGQTITYDTIGNPLTYRGMTLTWQQGRQLASATLANGTAISYRYNTDGIRIGKTVGNVTTEYLVDASGTIHAMQQGEHTLIFMYDATGRREGFICYSDTYGDAAYYYLYNAQGDVIGLTDGTLNTVVQYTYDAWGKPTGITGTKAATIGVLNPFRYRGYVYDTETGLYYVSSRYYDAEVGRFINADTVGVLTASPTALTDKNLFAYCDNNPVVRADLDGEFWHVIAGAVIGGVFELGSQLLSGEEVNWAKVGVATLAGGVSAAAGPAGGALVSAAASATLDLIDGERDLGKIVASAAVSAGVSLVGSGVGKAVEKVGGKVATKALAKMPKSKLKATVTRLKPAIKGIERNKNKSMSYLTSNHPDIGHLYFMDKKWGKPLVTSIESVVGESIGAGVGHLEERVFP